MIDKMTSRVVLGLLVVAGILIVTFAWYKARHAATPDLDGQHNMYHADLPPSAPLPGDARLLLLTPQELAKAPLADVFIAPLGDDNGAFSYVAQGFGDMNVPRGRKHVGEDWNGIGGENTDEGLPVRAVATGLLIYAGEPSPDWGNVVVLLHRLPDGRFVQSLYAHLKSVSEIPLGALVSRGEQIGTVGTAHGNYLAHLHFEMMESVAHEAGLPGYGQTTFNRIDPATVMKQYAPAPELLIPDPVQALKKVQMATDWGKLMENLYKENSPAVIDQLLTAPAEASDGKVH